MRINNLRVNYIENPLGYQMDDSVFSWTVTEANGAYAKHTRLIVWEEGKAEKLVYDSGVLENYRRNQLGVTLELKPRTRYAWQVQVEDETGDSGSSETSYFETGKMDEAWEAKWIGITDQSNQMPVLFHKILVESSLKNARLYICGLGLYEVYINGEKVSEEYLTPGYHSYDCYLEYQTYAVENYLHTGKNTIAVLLGNGWYKGRFGFDGDYRNLYGEELQCIAELRMKLDNGEECTLGTGENWFAESTCLLDNNIYDGEIIDETVLIEPLQVKLVTKPKVPLDERTNPPARKVECFKPQKIWRENDAIILDFGEMITGWMELEGSFTAGQSIRCQYGEILQDGLFYRENLRTAKAEFQVTCQGGKKKYRPHFTYYGFRYVKVEGTQENQDISYVAYRLMSDIRQTGVIETSNEKVNQLISNTLRSQKCNFLEIPTDCSQRDERMGWTGDASIFSDTACFHMDCHAFFRHYIKAVYEEAKKLGGSVPFFAPFPKIAPGENTNPFYMSSGAAGWADVATILPWNMYLHYGDKQLLKEQFPLMKNWVDYVTKRANENEVPYLWQNDRQLGDWLALDNGNPYSPIGKTDMQLLASAFYYHSAKLTYQAATELQEACAEEYKHLSERIKEAFLAYYFEQNNPKFETTQTACALLLAYGLYPEKGVQVLIAELKRLLAEN